MFLAEVIKEKKERVKEWKFKEPLPTLKRRLLSVEKRPFSTLFSPRGVRDVKIIAEVKRASPSLGEIKKDLDLTSLLSAYSRGGATAISVITEEKYFCGSLGYLAEAREKTSLPLLRKDFIVDEYEIYQSKVYGADAVLLISEALERQQIKDYLALAKEIDIDVLIEVHSLFAFEKVADFDGFLLGINNRNLHTLKVDLAIAEGLVKEIPSSFKVVIESGIKDRNDIERFLLQGLSNFLIGTHLMLSSDPEKMLRELIGERVVP